MVRVVQNAEVRFQVRDGHIDHRSKPHHVHRNRVPLRLPRERRIVGTDAGIDDEEIDIAALQKEINTLEAELTDVRKRMAGYLKELGVDA